MTTAPEIRIAFLGDSISEVGRSASWHGGASRPEANWASVAGKVICSTWHSQVRVAHFGIGGQNTYEGLGRLDVLREFAPHVVVVAFGANDCCHHFLVPEETHLALTSLVQEVRQRYGARVIVVGTAGDNPQKPFFRHLSETLAAQQAAADLSCAPFVDVRTAIMCATRQGALWEKFHLAEDNCHPNDDGHLVWADAFVKVFVAAFSPAEFFSE